MRAETSVSPSSNQARIVAHLKIAPSLDEPIPVISAELDVVGTLTPITRQLAADESVVDALYRWRARHMASFLTVFLPTREKTRSYLTGFSLADPARILFLVRDRHDRKVGHIGLCNISPSGAEIDNVIRGETVDVPNFMVLVHNA